MKRHIVLTLRRIAGPDRKLFLPSGLYEAADVPEYLTGELPGE